MNVVPLRQALDEADVARRVAVNLLRAHASSLGVLPEAAREDLGRALSAVEEAEARIMAAEVAPFDTGVV